MRDIEYKVLSNREIARDVFCIELDGDCSDITAPGQFVELKIPGRYLRRPISVCDWSENRLKLIYKVLGKGTEDMSYLESGSYITALSGLGNGFNIKAVPDRPVLAGGGVGVPPLYALCKRLIEMGRHPYVALGFNSSEDVFYEEEFRALGVPVNIATVDGSYGHRGLVTELIGQHDYALCCGPLPMLKAMHERVKGGQFSLEARMGCGFGACMGCSIETKSGAKRVCKEGPVFMREELIW